MASIQPTAATASRPTRSEYDLPPQELTEHIDGSITLDKRCAHVCLEALWEVEALAYLLAGLPEGDGNLFAVRGIASRILQLSGALMNGLHNTDEPTIAIECPVYVKLRGELKAA